MSGLKTPAQTSPWNYFQERYRHDPWALLCCTIMLNLTTGRALEGVHRDFFLYFPNAECAASGDRILMSIILEPLGMQNRRAERIIAMSRSYLSWDGQDPLQLPGIGKYGRDSYEIFVRGILVEDVQDKELKKYVAWAKALISSSARQAP